ncbi:kinase [Prochlorococcus marinus XMU1419]|uniref:kinase n=1 Tax=Prochlorococcus marinus TaxID=1219 RepID=UPI001ADA65E0|nr:kinase [Prochlorococcus marinus]MBO8233769.1 kinase [Prochlorococcus marinus XMU1419]MBW3077239.1 kinase [Prochlorococcus marinus str. XMU1419]
MKDLDINFPLDKFEKLIIDIGWDSLDDWIDFCNNHKNKLLINKFWNNKVNDDWIWGLALPLLSQAYKFHNNFFDRKIIGLSALPGTGKTTLGNWLEAISLKLNFKIAVISIDDFYLPSDEMKLAIKNNPWNVSRGFPGSHSVNLMYEKLLSWKKNGELNVPVFDKSLRNGLGDRSHWRSDKPDLLILEGWFLGVEPLSIDLNDQQIINMNLSTHESSYRLKIQRNLKEYLDVWKLIDNIWQLKPLEFEYMNMWKSNQEQEMFLQKGNALQEEKLSDFLRMLNVSIPHKSFDVLNPYALLLIDQERNLIEAGLNF